MNEFLLDKIFFGSMSLLLWNNHIQLRWNPVSNSVTCKEKKNFYSNIASKPIYIQWIRTGFQPYWKIMSRASYYIQFSTKIKMYNHKIKTSFFSPAYQRIAFFNTMREKKLFFYSASFIWTILPNLKRIFCCTCHRIT